MKIKACRPKHEANYQWSFHARRQIVLKLTVLKTTGHAAQEKCTKGENAAATKFYEKTEPIVTALMRKHYLLKSHKNFLMKKRVDGQILSQSTMHWKLPLMQTTKNASTAPVKNHIANYHAKRWKMSFTKWSWSTDQRGTRLVKSLRELQQKKLTKTTQLEDATSMNISKRQPYRF